MRRIGLAAVDTGSAGNLYRQSFTCTTVDATALKRFDVVVPGEINQTEGEAPTVAPEQGFQPTT
jgi:hypothetical protein